MTPKIPTLETVLRAIVAGHEDRTHPGTHLVPDHEAMARAALAALDAGKLRLTLSLDHDECPISPADCDGTWMLYSLNGDHAGSTGKEHYSPGKRAYRVREERAEEFLEMDDAPQEWLDAPQEWLKKYMAAGLAWPLETRHSDSTPWAICENWLPEDGVDGWLVWEEPAENMGAKTKAERRKDAESFLAQWNAWATGAVYCFALTDANGDTVPDGTCGGYILATKEDEDYLASEIRCAMPEGARIVSVTGGAAWLADSLDLPRDGKEGR